MLNGPGNPGSLAIHGFSPLPLLTCWEEQARKLKARCCYPSRSHPQLGTANCSEHKSKRCQCLKTPRCKRRFSLITSREAATVHCLLRGQTAMQEWVMRTGTLSWQRSSHSQCQYGKDKPCPQLPSPLRLNQKGKNTLLHRARGENEKQREKADSASLSHWTKLFQEARNEKRIGVMWCVPLRGGCSTDWLLGCGSKRIQLQQQDEHRLHRATCLLHCWGGAGLHTALH